MLYKTIQYVTVGVKYFNPNMLSTAGSTVAYSKLCCKLKYNNITSHSKLNILKNARPKLNMFIKERQSSIAY